MSTKLSKLVRESIGDNEEDQVQPLTTEARHQFLESVSKYGSFGKNVYRETSLKETTEQLKNIVEIASRFTVEEAGDWFDGVTVKRHVKSMQESYKVFENTAKEMDILQQRLEHCYEDIGTTLNRYYEIRDGEEDADTGTEKIDDKSINERQMVSKKNGIECKGRDYLLKPNGI